MKLRNKKTGEIGIYLYSNSQHIGIGFYSVMPEKNPMWIIEYGHDFEKLYKEWDFIGEDYEEPKVFYYIKSNGDIVTDNDTITKDFADDLESMGNYFATKEEAEKAVEKLKAWKRLEDKGAIFKDWFWDKHYGTCIILGTKEKDCVEDENEEVRKDLDLLFGGEK